MKKLTTLFISLVLSLSMIFSLSACSPMSLGSYFGDFLWLIFLEGGLVGHTHDFSKSWSSDNVYHWHKCYQEGCEEVYGLEKHSFEGGFCIVCGHKDTKNSASVSVK